MWHDAIYYALHIALGQPIKNLLVLRGHKLMERLRLSCHGYCTLEIYFSGLQNFSPHPFSSPLRLNPTT